MSTSKPAPLGTGIPEEALPGATVQVGQNTLTLLRTTIERMQKTMTEGGKSTDLDVLSIRAKGLSIEELKAEIQNYNAYFQGEEVISLQEFIAELEKLGEINDHALTELALKYSSLLPKLETLLQRFFEMRIFASELFVRNKINP